MRLLLFVVVIVWISSGCVQVEQKDSRLLITDGIVREKLPRISPTSIKKLQIERAELRKEEFELIGAFKNLELLRLDRCKIEENCLHSLLGLKQLSKLTITQCETTDSDLEYIGGLEDLQALKLGSEHVTDAGLQHLANLRNLRDLSLIGIQVTNAGLAHLAPLENLEMLHLSASTTGLTFDSLAKLTSLRHLELVGHTIDDDTMRHLSQLKNLRTLSLSLTNVTDVGLMYVSKNVCLVKVSKSKQMTFEGIQKFRETLLQERRNARAMGLDVPADDTLVIEPMVRPRK